MKKLLIDIETQILVNVAEGTSEEELLEIARNYKNVVVAEARKNNAKSKVHYEIIEE